jgi:hypothetical protein
MAITWATGPRMVGRAMASGAGRQVTRRSDSALARRLVTAIGSSW